MRPRGLCLALVLSAAAMPCAGAQAPGDSVAAWTAALQSGTLPQRIAAMSSLAPLGAQLPAGTQVAVLAELERVSQAMLSGAPIPGAADAGSEAFGEYYVNLAATAGTFRTPTADRALVPAVGVSAGIQRRVARLGDEGIPQLAAMIVADYQPADALETMGLAWFWADSTGAPLSDQSRRTILSTLFAAASGSPELKSGLDGALRNMNDGALLPFATEIVRRALAANDMDIDVGYLNTRVIPALRTAASGVSTTDLARRTRRLVVSLCAGVTSGPRQGACQSLTNQLDNAINQLASGQNGPARNVVQALIARADHARSDGAITDLEYSLIVGDAQLILARLP